MEPLLTIQNLRVAFDTHRGEVKAVDNISFHVAAGEAVGIVGESGCGKSVTAHAVMRLVPVPPGRYSGGKILFRGENLLEKSESAMRKIRGNDISMIFQDPMTSLNPVLTVGLQLTEPLRLHQRLSRQAARTRAVELLHLAGIADPEDRLHQYPHQFSGGMRQRVMIAMALAGSPRLLIADEPTTALDVTIQAQILELMKTLQTKLTMSIILISHDLGAIAGLCSRIVVMYAGRIAEEGPADEIFHQPRHPYTQGLLRSLPRLDVSQQQPLAVIEGQPPDLLTPPTGCRFHPRCPHARQICAREGPPSIAVGVRHLAACWLHHPDAANAAQEVAGS